MTTIIDISECVRDHYNNPGTIATIKDPVDGLCWACLRDRSYSVQRILGSDYHGEVKYVGYDGTIRTGRLAWGFTNAGFNGILFADANTNTHQISAGRIIV